VENGGKNMDISRQLKAALNTGSMLFGQRQTVDACARGEAKLVILAANCPQDYIDDLHAHHPSVTLHRVHMVNRDLGVACAKPFAVSTVCVTDAGNSDLMSLQHNIE
jgi:large subunit ribosomal protein L30e